MRVERPAMVGALNIFSIEVTSVERHTAVRTGVAQHERMADSIAPNNQWNLQQRRFVKLITVHSVRWQRAIPEAGKHQRIGRLALGRVGFGYGKIVDSDFLIVAGTQYASIRRTCRRTLTYGENLHGVSGPLSPPDASAAKHLHRVLSGLVARCL